MKRLFIPMILIVMIFSLSSCSYSGITIKDATPSQSGTPGNTNNTNDSQGESNTENTPTVTPDYKDPSIQITDSDTPSTVTPVEETVSNVYDSVVSINVLATTFTGSGSGVLFAEDENLGLSYIVTCFHVIEDAYKYEVTLTNGDVYTASLVGGYRDDDLSVLSIEETDLTYASFYTDSDALKLGSQVVCIGNPLGILPGSVSSGYLSYVNREVAVDEYSTMTLLQTDVAINSGNSGGGLFNTGSALIGIVNAKYADEDIEGLGFAIPINTVRDVVNKIMSTARYDAANKLWDEGYYEGDWEFGFTISDGYTGISYRPGGFNSVIYISDVSSNLTKSGASLLELDDIITGISIDYQDEASTDFAITSLDSAEEALVGLYSSDLSLGDCIIFTITRNNVSQTITVELIQFIYSV